MNDFVHSETKGPMTVKLAALYVALRALEEGLEGTTEPVRLREYVCRMWTTAEQAHTTQSATSEDSAPTCTMASARFGK